jgi:hypothetical protein
LHRSRLSTLDDIAIELLSGNALFKRPRRAAESLARSKGDTFLKKLLCFWRCATRKKSLERSRHTAAHTCADKSLWDTLCGVALCGTKPIKTALYSTYFSSTLYAKPSKSRATG